MNTESEIRTIMTLDPNAVKASTLISRVIELFESEKIHHMPVVDEQRHVVGIISSSDLQQIDKRYALCTMCVGVGQGVALIIERV